MCNVNHWGKPWRSSRLNLQFASTPSIVWWMTQLNSKVLPTQKLPRNSHRVQVTEKRLNINWNALSVAFFWCGVKKKIFLQPSTTVLKEGGTDKCVSIRGDMAFSSLLFTRKKLIIDCKYYGKVVGKNIVAQWRDRNIQSVIFHLKKKKKEVK